MPSIIEIFEAIAKDEAIAIGLFDTLDELKESQKSDIAQILNRYLVSNLVDDNGFIKPGALTDERLQEFEDELIGYFDYDNLDPYLNDVLNTFDTRLNTIDDLMISLELTDGILGEDVFELPVVLDEIDTVANSMIEARNGDGDFDGSLKMIKDSFAKYRLDRSKGREVLLDDLKSTLRKHADVLPNYTNSIATTSLARMDRSLRRTQSVSAGIEYGKYVGPLDDVTRPFCVEQHDEVRKWTEWDSLENNMTIELYKSPVSKVGGGINCRHRIIPWMLSWSEGRSKAEIRKAMIKAYHSIAA